MKIVSLSCLETAGAPIALDIHLFTTALASPVTHIGPSPSLEHEGVAPFLGPDTGISLCLELSFLSLTIQITVANIP